MSEAQGGEPYTFGVALRSAPSADVAISFIPSDPTEGTVSPASLTFTPATWSTAQPVTGPG